MVISHTMADFPFFIVGCGRSGTSLLRAELIKRTNAAIPLESLFITDYLRVKDRLSVDAVLTLLIAEPEIREWGLNIKAANFQHCRSVVEVIRTLHEKYAEKEKKERWGHKTPRFIRALDLISSNFPEAHFIHIVRDPRAVASSLIRSDVHRSNAFFAAKRWVLDVNYGLEFERHNPDKMIRMNYETLVLNPGATLDKIANYLELRIAQNRGDDEIPGAGEYSRFYKNIHANLNQPLTQQYVDRWKEDLSPDEVRVVEAISGELMEELGYPRMMPEAKLYPADRIIGRWTRLVGMVRQSWRYLIFRPRYLLYLLWRKARLSLLRDFLGKVHY